MRIWLLLWLVLILAHANSSSIGTALVSGQCLGDQKSLLLELKNSLNFNASLSTKLIQWNPSNDSWNGVTCEGGQVTGLDMSNESIASGLDDSSSLFRLNHLQRLNLAFNSFQSAEIPSRFGNLTNLIYLNLSNAGFAGQVPIGISHLMRLVTLDISNYTGLTSLELQNPNLKMLVANLSELRELYLDGVKVSATGNELCDALSSSLPKLQVVSMMNCYLSGPVESCSSLVHLRSLSVINLGGNSLNTTFPEFFSHFHNLTTLQLSNCSLQGEFPQEIFKVLTLQTLDLSFNELLQGSLPEFPENGSLQTLALSYTNISGRLPESIGNLINLSSIELQNCGLHGNIPSSFTNLSRLAYLDLSLNNFTSSIPSLSKSKNLAEIDLSDNNLTGKIDSTQWECLSSLSFLNLGSNLLEGNMPSSLFALPSIRYIILSNNRFSGLAKGSFNATSHVLEHLDLSNNNFNGSIPSSLFTLPSIRYIGLSSNRFSSLAKGSFNAASHKLDTLDLSNNNFSGSIPSSLFALPSIQNIYLSNNRFSGLPKGSFNATSHMLEYLDLSYNNFSGSLPSSLFTLPSIQNIDLSNNRFSGLPKGSFNATSHMLNTLHLSNNNFSGSLSSSLFTLPSIQNIDLSNNRFSSLVKGSFSAASPTLDTLDLSNNNFSGSIPSSLFALPSIQHIYLSNNRFSSLPKGSFNVASHTLDTLDLSNNNIGGELPVSMWELQGLKYLDLSSNNFSGSFHINVLQQLRNLSYLDLSYSGFSIDATNTASHASSFPDLHYLYLASCQLRTFPEFLVEQHNLTSLDLSDNQIQGEIPKWIWKLQNLQYLNLSSNLLDDIGTSSPNLTSSLAILDLHKNRIHGQMLPLPPSVTYMDFSSNNFTLVIPPAIGTSLSSAVFFSLSNNSFQGFIPKSICKAINLEVLDLSHNNLSGNIPDCLAMQSLKVLNLGNNALDGSIINFPETCGLKTLAINSNRLREKFPKSMANCTTLEVLDVGDNQIDDVFPCELKSIASLRVLVLRSNKFHGRVACLEFNGNWTRLQIVDISSNSFRGTLPAQWLTSWDAMKANADFNHIQVSISRYSGLFYQDTVGITVKGLQVELVKILIIFTSIDFSCNNFEGPIPETLGDLKALHFLNLSRNALSGPIPSSLGRLEQLESLDLSWNDLNGTISIQLSDLNFLSALNLSYNKLVGSIPAVKQFLTFSASSFEGNVGLCGQQLGTSCSITANGTKEAGDDGDDNDNVKKWFYLGMPFGFIIGFWAFCGPLVFIKSWRLAYYRFWDKVLFRHFRP